MILNQEKSDRTVEENPLNVSELWKDATGQSYSESF